MSSFQQNQINFARRQFFTSTASGLGAAAMLALLQKDGLLAADESHSANPLAPKRSPFPAKAKQCIFFLPEGAPSQIDLFDPKPKLNELHGQKAPDSLIKNIRFAFIKKESAVMAGSVRKFSRFGQCGMELSDLLPHLGSHADDILLVRSMHTDAFNHHPAQLMLNSGVARFGRPSMGAWLTYGLGSESENLPGYVVLPCGRGGSGGVSNWTSGFFPSTYEGVVFRGDGEPVLNLNNPPGLDRDAQQRGLAALNNLNRRRLETLNDPEIASRIASYELAFRMQTAAPELTDLSTETQHTLDMYGVTRKEPEKNDYRGGGPNIYRQFATNCLLARRLIERGVRFVTMIHASWDHHSNIDEELPYCTGMADQPLAALIADLKQRGLLDTTLLIFAGEFGRTPIWENRGGTQPDRVGRDHHPSAFSIWMAGGGLKGGLTYGETDDICWQPTKDPVHINDFHATLLHLFGFDHFRFSHRFKGLDVRLTDQGGKVIGDWIA